MDSQKQGGTTVAMPETVSGQHVGESPLDTSIKVAVVTHTLAIGGSPRSLLNVAAALQARQLAPVLYFGKQGPLAGDFISAGIPSRHLPKKKGFLGLHLGFIHQILRWYRLDEIRVVFLNCLIPYYKYHAIAARILRLPVIWSIRENIRSKRVHRLLGYLKRLSTRLVPCSEEIAAKLREEGLSVPIHVVHNGIDVSASDPRAQHTLRQRLNIPGDHWVIGCVGSIEARKGQLDLIEAAGALPAEIGPLDIVIIGAPGGRGEADPYYRDLKQKADRLPDHVSVHFYGAYREILSLYTDMNLVCLPTYWEGSSRAILEAMLYRRPLLTTTAGGNPEILRHKESAYLVPAGDRRALAEGLIYLRNHPEKAAAFADRAFIDLKTQYTNAHYAERMGVVFDGVIRCRPGAS
jgi:glycosyltransferase involved in cell wall biosynthesis